MLPNRPYEHVFAPDEALASRTGDFKTDFGTFIRWCTKNVTIPQDNRLAMNMPPEPYRFSPATGEAAGSEAFVAHAESVVGEAWDSWSWLYQHLADAASKDMLLTVLAYRTLGWQYTPMPLDTPPFWNKLAELTKVEDGTAQADRLDTQVNGIHLSKFALAPFGYDLDVFSDAFGVFNEFIYSQYVYRGADGVVGCKPGDVALDCGACFGGTSLFLADRVGQNGRVFSFEFFPGNLDVYERNLGLNPNLKQRIELIKHPVWSDNAAEVVIEGSGPATQVHLRPTKKKSRNPLKNLFRKPELAPDEVSFKTVAIDALVDEGRIDRVNFIKMDIEGAELTALRGARQTIERFKPTLAICVYHKLIDFYEIPQFLDELDLGYRFYLQHSTVHGDETVLFASVDA